MTAKSATAGSVAIGGLLNWVDAKSPELGIQKEERSEDSSL
jgi:hypothetical protein